MVTYPAVFDTIPSAFVVGSQLSMLHQLNIRAVLLARIGLFSMLLLTLGPLIGQLTAPKMSAMMMPHSVSQHDHSAMPSHASQTNDTMQSMHHVWYEQCGYCSLVQHFPFLSSTVPAVVRDAFITTWVPVEFVRSAFNSAALFLHALKRAPPTLHA